MESHPQVESIARIESTISTIDVEPIDAEKKPIHISIRLIGDKGIGKASIVDRYLGRKTEEEQASSSKNPSTDTAVDQGLSQEYSSSITVDGREVILHIWSGTISKDFEWHPLAAGVFNEGLMFVFDSTDESSYESIKQQFSIYYSAGDYSNRVDKPEVILVGTNCRTDNKIRFYDWVLSELTRYMEDHTGEKFIGYYETNFESGANLREVFDVLINKVLDNCDPTRREILSPVESPPAKTTTKIDFVNLQENRQATRSDRKLLRQNLNKAKRQHGKIPVRFLKVFFTGSGAAGKTSFVRLLLKKKFNEFHHSTNVIHTNHAVSVNMVAFQGAPTKKVTWVELDSSLELGYLRSVLLSPPSKALSHPPSPSTARRATASLAENTSSSRPVESQGYQTPIQPESTIKSFFAGLFASSVKVSDLATFENLVSSSTGNKFEYQPGKVLNIITLLDTGGQPEYIHLLPTINIYPTVTFVVHNLAKSLTDQVLVEFSQHGKLVFAPYHLSYTNLDMIKLLMSAANDSVERPTSRIPQLVTKPGTNNKSFICLVGTHVDEVSPDLVKKTDKALTKLVRKTQCEAAVWQKANGNVLFSVDNTTSGNESLAEDPVADEMRKRIESLAAEKEVYELPITWMLLELEIQQICTKRKKAYISFQECVIVARDTGLISDEEEVRSVLQYHHLLGVLIYFEEVPGLCNYVIVDHQWWFDKLSGIICITFQQGSNNFHAVQKLKYQGILSKDLLKHVEWKDDIKEDYFLSLLTHMKIIAPLFNDKRKKGERGKQDVKKEYFIPYVLPTYSFSKKKDEILKQYGHLLGEPLLIQFKSGLLPRGLFCSLIVELLQHPLKNWEPHFSNDRKSHTFSNLITFSLPNAYSLSLLDKVSYLEVQIRHPEEDVQTKLREEALSYPIHNKVYNYLVYAITEVCIRLNFCDDRLQYGFLCQNCEYSEDHIAVLPLSSSSLTYAKCSIDSLHQIKMTSSNTIWFFRDQTAQNGELSRSISMASSVDSGVSVNLPPGQAPHYDRILSVPDATVPTHQMSQLQLGRFHSVPSHSINQSSARSSQSTNLEGYSESNLHEMTHSVSSMAIDGPTGATIESTVATTQQYIDSRYTRFVSVPAGVNPNHAAEANLLGVYGRSISVPQPHHQFTHGLAHSTSNLVFDDTGQQPTDRPSMKLLHEIVIPRIAAKWSTVADYLKYEVEFKEIIAVDCHHKAMDCCAYLLQDWLVNNRGVSPKSWSTLIGALREIKSLTATVEKIVEELKQRGIDV